MTTVSFYDELKAKFKKIVEDNGLMEEDVLITGRALSVEEAIGNPERQDYPIVKGKEQLMQAEFKGAKGQAFTDMSSSFKGSLQDVLERPLVSNFDRAVLISTINAVCRHLGYIENTIHCHDEAPEKCSVQLVEHIKNKYASPRVGLIGLQPAMLEKLQEEFSVRVVDLDPDNIGQKKSGVVVEGPEATEEVLEWCELIVATGSTVANETISDYITGKPVIFFGTTVAGTAHIMKLEQFCPMSS